MSSQQRTGVTTWLIGSPMQCPAPSHRSWFVKILKSSHWVRHGVSCTQRLWFSLQASVVHWLESSQLCAERKQLKKMQWSSVQNSPSSQSLSLRQAAARSGVSITPAAASTTASPNRIDTTRRDSLTPIREPASPHCSFDHCSLAETHGDALRRRYRRLRLQNSSDTTRNHPSVRVGPCTIASEQPPPSLKAA